MTRTVGVRQIYADPAPGKEFSFGQCLIGLKLLFFFSRQMGEEFFRETPRRFESDDAHGLVSFSVEKSRGKFTEIAMLKRPSAQPASRDRVDGVSRAAIDFDENDQSLAGLRLF